jgi:cytochrome c oxidase assembly factor CtaG
MSSGFPFRPEETTEGFWEGFVRISAVAWIVYLSYRIIDSEWLMEVVSKANIRISTPIKASILFGITVIASYFTAGFKTVVYRQSIS